MSLMNEICLAINELPDSQAPADASFKCEIHDVVRIKPERETEQTTMPSLANVEVEIVSSPSQWQDPSTQSKHVHPEHRSPLQTFPLPENQTLWQPADPRQENPAGSHTHFHVMPSGVTPADETVAMQRSLSFVSPRNGLRSVSHSDQNLLNTTIEVEKTACAGPDDGDVPENTTAAPGRMTIIESPGPSAHFLPGLLPDGHDPQGRFSQALKTLIMTYPTWQIPLVVVDKKRETEEKSVESY